MRVTLAGVALLLVTFAAFCPLRNAKFVTYDDQGYVTKNERVQRGLTVANVRWAFTTGDMANWQPVTWLAHMLDVELFGLDAGGHHLMNVGLHILNTGLVFAVFTTMTGVPWRSLAVAALFALHPLHVESVAWVSERKDVLSTAFALRALAAYVSWVRRPGAGRYLLVLVALALGLMTKPMLVTLPCVLLLLDRWPLDRRDAAGTRMGWPTLVVEKIPLFVVVAAMSVTTFLVQRHAGAVHSFAEFPLGARAANAIVAYGRYLQKTVWPVDLAPFYPLELPVPHGPLVASAMVLVALTGAAVAVGKRRPYVLIGWLWFVGMLVPVIGLVAAGKQAMADRYTYLPLLGPFVVLVWGAADLTAGWPTRRAILATVTGAVLTACFVLTRTQVSYWQDTTTLFQHALAVTRRNHIAHANLGYAAADAGRHAEAVDHYREALRLAPNFVEVHDVLGRELERVGTPESLAEAAEHFHAAVRLRPNDPEPYVNLGAVLLRQGRRDEARTSFSQALAIEPDDARAHNALGLLLAEDGQHEEAVAHHRAALRDDPELADAYYNLGNALAAAGRNDEAIAALTAALRLEPDQAAAHNNLGVILADVGRSDEAAEHYREAMRLAPGYVDPHINFAAFLRRSGQIDAAMAELETALRLAPSHADAHYMLGNVLSQSGRLDEAVVQYSAALAARPDDSRSANNLGLVLATQGKLDDAIGRYTEALRSDPAFAPAYYNRGVAYRRKG